MLTLGDRIKQERKAHKLTQEELGKICGVTKSTVCLYEKNKSTPSDDIKQILANYFGVSVDYLLGRTDVKNFAKVVADDLGKLTKEYNSALTEKDINIVKKDVSTIMNDLDNADGLTFYNEPLSEEDLSYIKGALEFAFEKIRIKNKEKYTPKKYKKG